MTAIYCDVCHKIIVAPKASGGTGYGQDENGKRSCYECCADQDRKWMQEKGQTTLYLTYKTAPRIPHEGHEGPDVRRGVITNWPGTLAFPVYYLKEGRHNIAGRRYDAWFSGPDGHIWHGVQYGDNTELIHCKRTKEKMGVTR